MCRARVTIDATMFATPVGIDGLFEWNIRGLITRNGGPAGIAYHLGHDPGRLPVPGPAVVHGLMTERLEPAVAVGYRAASLPHHCGTVTHDWSLVPGQDPVVPGQPSAGTHIGELKHMFNVPGLTSGDVHIETGALVANDYAVVARVTVFCIHP